MASVLYISRYTFPGIRSKKSGSDHPYSGHTTFYSRIESLVLKTKTGTYQIKV